eukprot:2376996-Pyramimonas_sp.AAC.1
METGGNQPGTICKDFAAILTLVKRAFDSPTSSSPPSKATEIWFLLRHPHDSLLDMTRSARDAG